MALLVSQREVGRLVNGPNRSLRFGTVFASRYVLGECLYGPTRDEPALSEVYVAQDTQANNGAVALKVSILPSGYCISPYDDPFWLDFNNEARMLKRSLHPALPKFISAGCVNDLNESNYLYPTGKASRSSRHYIAMERLVGIELDSLIKRSLPFWQALDIMLQLLNCSGAEHEAGFVDLDIKAENVLLQSDGIVRRYDLAFASELENGYLFLHRFKGTPEYAAPEQRAASHVQPNADIYALGIIFYEMLVGRHTPISRPLPSVEAEEITGLSKTQKRAQTFGSILKEINRIIALMTEESPKDRYQSTKCVMQDLKNEAFFRLCHEESWYTRLLKWFL